MRPTAQAVSTARQLLRARRSRERIQGCRNRRRARRQRCRSSSLCTLSRARRHRKSRLSVCVRVSPCLGLYSSCVCHTNHVNDAHTHVRRVLWRRVLQAARQLPRCRLPSPHSTSRIRRRCLRPRRRRHCMPPSPNRRRWSQMNTHRSKRATRSANSPTVHLRAQQLSPSMSQELLGLRQKAAATMRALLTRRRTQMHRKWIKWSWRPSSSSCMLAQHPGGRRSGRGTQPPEAVEAPGRGRLAGGVLKAKAKANLPWWRPRAPALTRL